MALNTKETLKPCLWQQELRELQGTTCANDDEAHMDYMYVISCEFLQIIHIMHIGLCVKEALKYLPRTLASSPNARVQTQPLFQSLQSYRTHPRSRSKSNCPNPISNHFTLCQIGNAQRIPDIYLQMASSYSYSQDCSSVSP